MNASVELGMALNKADELRLVADYKGDSVALEHAAWAVSQAEMFVRTMRSVFTPARSNLSPKP